MKLRNIKIITGACRLVAFFLFITVITACGGDDGPTEPTAQELAFEDLAGTWLLETITLDGQDVSLNYSGFSLSFSETSYSIQNGGDLFRASGTWQWANETTTNIVDLDDGKSISIQVLNSNQFRFAFVSSGSGGVVAGTAGSYTIEMIK